MHHYSSYTPFTRELLNDCLWKIKQGSQKKVSSFAATEAAVRKCSSKLVFLKTLQYSLESTCVGVSFNKVAGLNACNFLKNRLQCKCFPVNIAKFFKTSFSIEHLWSMLLRLNLNLSSAVKILWSFLLYSVVTLISMKQNVKPIKLHDRGSFISAFHFVEIQSTFCPYLQNGLDFLN